MNIIIYLIIQSVYIKNIIIYVTNIIIFIIINRMNIKNIIICVINIINKIINKFEKILLLISKKYYFLYYKFLQYFYEYKK